MQNKREKITSPRDSPISDTTIHAVAANFFKEKLNEGLALRSAFSLAVASPVRSTSNCSSSFDLLGKQTSSLAFEPQSRQQDT